MKINIFRQQYIAGLILVSVAFLINHFNATKQYLRRTPGLVLAGQRPHKIRHMRHLYSKMTNWNGQKYDNECIVERWSYADGNLNRQGCPNKKCRSNRDCWREYEKAEVCVCDPFLCGPVCIDADEKCPYPNNPENGKVIIKGLRVGQEVEYTCRPGYAVKGPRKRYCQANMKWSGVVPECTDQTDFCFSPPYIPNSIVENESNRNNYRNREKIRIVCQKGFEDLRNSYTIALCEGNDWKYSPLLCKRISCGKLNDPTNGRTMYTDMYLYQSSAIPFCNDGYNLVCPNVKNANDDKPCKRVCQANRQWSGVPAVCKPVLCPNLQEPDNGIMEGWSNKVNNIRRFRCNKGFQLTGSHIRNCQLNGQWDGWPARCVIRDCGKPPTVPFSSVSFEKTTYDSSAVYRCKKGTTLIGKSSILICGVHGNSSTWIPVETPKCMHHCRPLSVPNAQVVIDNNSTYQNINLRLKVPHDAKITVTCSKGFEPSQKVKPLCNNGSWTYIPFCVEASCVKRPDAESNSLVRFYSLKHNSIARYYCHYGYRVRYHKENGDTVYAMYYDIRCIKGRWTKSPENGCMPTKCEMPGSPINGKVFLKGEDDQTDLTNDNIRHEHGRVVEYKCLPDYRLIGPRIAVCLNGRWSPPETPTCQFIMHDELPLSWLFYDRSSPDSN